MWLREFLSKDVTYYGLDYTSRSDDTIVCDLNAREFPDIKTDVVFCSGLTYSIHGTTDLTGMFEAQTLSVSLTSLLRIPVSSRTLRTLDYALSAHIAVPLPSCSASLGRYMHTLHIVFGLS